MDMISLISSIKSIAGKPLSLKPTKRKEELPCDIFEKRIECVSWDEKKLQEIFDKTYTKVIRQHKIILPEIGKINLQKPNIELKAINNSAAASYTFSDNTISFNPLNLKEDYYSIDFLDKKGKIKKHIATATESQVSSTKIPKKGFKKASYTKLTNKEKEVYVATMLAHELRHFIQNHIIASTAVASDMQKDEYNKIYNKIKEIVSTLNEKEIEILGNFDVEKIFCYAKNYKPKELLDENTVLRYSILDENDRCWSIKKHLLMSEIERLENENSGINDAYFANCNEVDAYQYEYEFFLSQIGEFSNDFREDILCAIACELETTAKDALAKMLAKGVNFENE